jgi:hypothetical protein
LRKIHSASQIRAPILSELCCDKKKHYAKREIIFSVCVNHREKKCKKLLKEKRAGKENILCNMKMRKMKVLTAHKSICRVIYQH